MIPLADDGYSDYPTCEVEGCGRDLDYELCWKCGGEGTTDDLHELDPLWYAPGTFETCDECRGYGSFSKCEKHGYILPELESRH